MRRMASTNSKGLAKSLTIRVEDRIFGHSITLTIEPEWLISFTSDPDNRVTILGRTF